MLTNPLISIITITRNAADVIIPTMKSVKEQEFSDFEHIIIDGASSDRTLALAVEYGTDNLRIVSESDKGLYDAMNKGLRLARGKYVIFLNAGDAFHSPDILPLYAREAVENDADIVYSDTVIVDSSRRIIGPRHLSAPLVLTEHSFSDGMLICHQAFMARRELCPKYDLSFRFSADYDWCIKVIDRSRPKHRIFLGCVGIDYLSDGLTDKNRMKSLRERFHIMAERYGIVPTVARHFKFALRGTIGKISKFHH